MDVFQTTPNLNAAFAGQLRYLPEKAETFRKKLHIISYF